MMTQALGWFASVVLLLTIGAQIRRQWKSGTSQGVSRWLFIGEMISSLAFVAYSALLHNTVFIFTNVLLAISAVVGLAIVIHHRRQEEAEKGQPR